MCIKHAVFSEQHSICMCDQWPCKTQVVQSRGVCTHVRSSQKPSALYTHYKQHVVVHVIQGLAVAPHTQKGAACNVWIGLFSDIQSMHRKSMWGVGYSAFINGMNRIYALTNTCASSFLHDWELPFPRFLNLWGVPNKPYSSQLCICMGTCMSSQS